ncbi:MAG: VOC family protein [Sphingomonadaceae bacterium]
MPRLPQLQASCEVAYISGMNLNRIYHMNINVTDLDRSIGFYEKLGFKTLVRFELDEETTRATCAAFGAAPNRCRAAFLRLGDDPAAPCLDLVEWLTEPTQGQPYPEANHTGIYRIAFHVDDPDAILAELEELGIPLMGPVGHGNPPGGGRSTVFAFRDPDGTVLEILSGVEHMVR